MQPTAIQVQVKSVGLSAIPADALTIDLACNCLDTTTDGVTFSLYRAEMSDAATEQVCGVVLDRKPLHFRLGSDLRVLSLICSSVIRTLRLLIKFLFQQRLDGKPLVTDFSGATSGTVSRLGYGLYVYSDCHGG